MQYEILTPDDVIFDHMNIDYSDSLDAILESYNSRPTTVNGVRAVVSMTSFCYAIKDENFEVVAELRPTGTAPDERSDAAGNALLETGQQSSGDFGREYDYIEDSQDVFSLCNHMGISPMGVSAAYTLLNDGEYIEVWLCTDADHYSNNARFTCVYADTEI